MSEIFRVRSGKCLKKYGKMCCEFVLKEDHDRELAEAHAEIAELGQVIASKDNRIIDLTSELQDMRNTAFTFSDKLKDAMILLKSLNNNHQRYVQNATEHAIKLEAELKRLNKQLDEFWEHLDYGWAIEPRAELEKIAKESWNPPNPLLVALHYIWKREAKTPEKDKLIEQMRNALKIAAPCVKEIFGYHSKDYTEVKVALSAAERGE